MFVVFCYVKGVCCVFLGSTEAALMAKCTPISRRPTKCAMTSTWIHRGARSAPLCTQATLMAPFAGPRKVGVKVSMRAASVDPKNTQHTPLTITKITKNDFFCPTSNRYHSISFVKTNAPRGFPSSRTAVLTDFLKKTPKKIKKTRRPF